MFQGKSHVTRTTYKVVRYSRSVGKGNGTPDVVQRMCDKVSTLRDDDNSRDCEEEGKKHGLPSPPPFERRLCVVRQVSLHSSKVHAIPSMSEKLCSGWPWLSRGKVGEK